MAKKNITITLKLGELLYDVQNRTHLAGRDREDARAGAHIQATDDEESSNAVKRGLQRALSRVRQAVNEWAHIDAIVNDNTLLSDTSGSMVLILPMPTNYNDGATAALTSAMHRYVVNSTIADWLNDVSPDDSLRYTAAAHIDLLDVRDAVLERRRPDRRTACGYSDGGSGSGTSPTNETYLWLDDALWLDNTLWLEHR